DFDEAAFILVRLDREDDVGRWGTLNREFHLTLYRSCGNRRLFDLIEVQHKAADRYVRILLSSLDYRSRSQEEHRALLQACQKGDGALAQRILSAHLGEASQTLIASLEGR
ncbi:GntR family transcriptional regulator, partial [Rhizobiaceae sp. 2RAB30]